MKLVAVVQLVLAPEWFSLSQEQRLGQRERFFELIDDHPTVEVRWFDSDPWTGSSTEFLVCEFQELESYWKFWEAIREHTAQRRLYASFQRVSLGYERPLTIGLVET
ncbi:hypothetical protein JST97_19960 [bacterium]|nr:hypothetical protein [bacterium]